MTSYQKEPLIWGVLFAVGLIGSHFFAMSLDTFLPILAVGAWMISNGRE